MVADKLQMNTAMCLITLYVQNCTIQTICVLTLVTCLYNLNFRKEVGITIKSKETSSKLVSYENHWLRLYKLHWLLFVSVNANLQDLIPTVAALL